MAIAPAPVPAPVPETTSPSRTRLSLPESVNVRQWKWEYVIGISAMHLAALLALWPALFSWSGVALAVAGLYVFGTLGVNLCYHRLLTHRGFECPRFLEHGLALIGVCCLQDTPANWVAIHRMHHQYSDDRPDPHSPLVTFFWGHVGWLLVKNDELSRLSLVERYAKDLLRDPFYLRLERGATWVWVNVVQWSLFFVGGFVAGWLTTGTLAGGWWLAWSWLVWGAIVRTVAVWHITWSVNSLSHMFGYQTYDTRDDSRNNALVGILSNGEGWHNNHHAEPRAAAHGHRWWEIDVTFYTIKVLSWVGLAWNVVLPKSFHPATAAAVSVTPKSPSAGD